MHRIISAVVSWSSLGLVAVLSFSLIVQGFVNLNGALDSYASVATVVNASDRAKSKLEEVAPLPFREPEETNEIIVKYKSSVGESKRASIATAEKLKKKSTIDSIDVVVYEVDADDTSREVTDRIKQGRKDDIEFVEVNMKVYPAAYVPNDPYYGSEWHIQKVMADTAWDTTKGEGVTIADMDTGVNCAHPDLAANCVTGYNAVTGTTDTPDINGHGTLTSGTIASVGDNGVGGTGVAYNAKILPLNIATDSSGATTCDIPARAITWAADHGIKVVSNSYFFIGCTVTNSAAAYLASKGGVYVRAAGNEGVDQTALVTQYDPSVNDPNIVIVSATDQNDVRYSWSTYGKHVDIAAPGNPIYCTTREGGYGNCWGTSFSVPIVSGVLGLMYSVNPQLTASQARNILFSTADDVGPSGWDIEYGWGRVNAAKAVALARDTTGGNVQDTQAPSTPTNLTASNITSSSVTLTWTGSLDNVGVSGYDIYRNGTKLTTVTGTSYTNSGLSGNTAYTYTVAARDAAGNVSPQSNTVSVNTADVPFGISGSSVTTKTTTSATIGVTLTKPGTVTVKYGKSTTALTSSAQSSTSGTSHSVSLTGLTAKTTYYYQVVATDASGTTVNGPISSFKTAAGGGKR